MPTSTSSAEDVFIPLPEHGLLEKIFHLCHVLCYLLLAFHNSLKGIDLLYRKIQTYDPLVRRFLGGMAGSISAVFSFISFSNADTNFFLAVLVLVISMLMAKLSILIVYGDHGTPSLQLGAGVLAIALGLQVPIGIAYISAPVVTRAMILCNAIGMIYVTIGAWLMHRILRSFYNPGRELLEIDNTK